MAITAENEYRQRLARAVVEVRYLRGKSQATLALDLGVSEPTLSRWETGKTQPRAYELHRLAEVLRAPADLFIHPPPWTPSPIAELLTAEDRDVLVEELDDLTVAEKAAAGKFALRASLSRRRSKPRPRIVEASDNGHSADRT